MSDTSVIFNQDSVLRRPELRRASAANAQSSNDSHRPQRPVTVSYELSEDMRAKEVEFIERRYGGRFASQRAARIIQNSYREYQMRKDYDKLKVEKRVSRKLDLPTINHSNQSLFRSPTSPTSPEIVKTIKQNLKKQTSYEDVVIEQAYKDWDAEFTEENGSTRKSNKSEKETILVNNADSGVDSVETSSVSLTPSPTAAVSFSSTLLVTSIDSNATISNAMTKSDCCDFNDNSQPNNLTQSTKSIPYSSNSNICDNSFTQNFINASKSPHLQNISVFTDLNSNRHYPQNSSIMHSNFSNSQNLYNFPKNFTTSPIAEYLSNPRLIGSKFSKGCYCHTANDRRHKRLYRICLNIFNKNSVKGVFYLMRYKFVEPQPHMLAKFLMNRKGLSRTGIGDYLGQTKDAFALETLKVFSRMVDMKNKEIDVALRHLLSFFQIPGESQKIIQIMEEFKESYLEQNPFWLKTFRNSDSIMILAYAIIMLHTDIYNPNIRKQIKMSKEAFINNLRKIDDGCDLDSEMLGQIYERIKAAEMKTFSDHTIQVRKIYQHFTGNLRPQNLVQAHRRLVCYCRLYEVLDFNKKERPGAHQREVFLFNDLLVITKSVMKRKKDGVQYQCRKTVTLNKIQVYLFETYFYPCGIQLKCEDENLGMFNTRNLSDRKRFIDDLMDTISEVRDMDRLRIEEQHIVITSPKTAAANILGGCHIESGLAESVDASHCYKVSALNSSPTKFLGNSEYMFNCTHGSIGHQRSGSTCSVSPIGKNQQHDPSASSISLSTAGENYDKSMLIVGQFPPGACCCQGLDYLQRQSQPQGYRLQQHQRCPSLESRDPNISSGVVVRNPPNFSDSLVSTEKGVPIDSSNNRNLGDSRGVIDNDVNNYNNVYNQQNRISGDSGLQEDFD